MASVSVPYLDFNRITVSVWRPGPDIPGGPRVLVRLEAENGAVVLSLTELDAITLIQSLEEGLAALAREGEGVSVAPF